MGKTRKVEPSVIEIEMQESRNKAKFVDEVERISIEQMVESS